MIAAVPVSRKTLFSDFLASICVFLIALPLCLGIALASNAPLLSGLIAGIVGGIIVGSLSQSHTSVSGPAAGLTAVVAAQIAALGSFEAFLTAVMLAGIIQIGLGLAQAGFIAAFFPTSVIKGLLAAIGIILILKQIPHIFGRDDDPEGDMAFFQPDQENTFSEILRLIEGIHPAATVIGFASLALLIIWDRIEWLKKSYVPAPLLVVILGVVLAQGLANIGPAWQIGASHLVQVPVTERLSEFSNFLTFPDFSQLANSGIYLAALTIAIVASLETLLNLEAVDKIDPMQRNSPPSRELFAQGVGNLTAGLIGGLPVTSVIVRSSMNVQSGAKTKASAVMHGFLLVLCIMLVPALLNLIPLSCLAAILLVTGFKLASPQLFRQMWSEGRYQFIPFLVTVLAIVLNDLLVGVCVGLAVSISFILYSNARQPIRRFVEKHIGGEVLRVELAEQVSFLKRAALAGVLDSVPEGGHVLLDARKTDYIDPDVLGLIRDFKEVSGPARNIAVSLLGFKAKYDIHDHIDYVDYATRELQEAMTPVQALEVLREGHRRFMTGERLNRDLSRQVDATAAGQHPIAVVLSCIDSRAPVELIFDAGVGDLFSVRIAGNVSSPKVLGSIEYACAVAGSKLILVMGHSRCGAVTAAVRSCADPEGGAAPQGHVGAILEDILESVDMHRCRSFHRMSDEEKQEFIDDTARENVRKVKQRIMQESHTIAKLVNEGKVGIVGAIYDVNTGNLTFCEDVPNAIPLLTDESQIALT